MDPIAKYPGTNAGSTGDKKVGCGLEGRGVDKQVMGEEHVGAEAGEPAEETCAPEQPWADEAHEEAASERGTDANGKDVANARWNDAHSLECSGKRAVGEGDASRIVRAGENQSKIDVN